MRLWIKDRVKLHRELVAQDRKIERLEKEIEWLKLTSDYWERSYRALRFSTRTNRPISYDTSHDSR